MPFWKPNPEKPKNAVERRSRESPNATRNEIWALGGGKGGCGRTLVTANLGIALAQSGRSTLVFDGDLGGPNLHTMLGMEFPSRDLGDFLDRRLPSLQDVAVSTPIPNLKLIAGPMHRLDAANMKHLQKEKLASALRCLRFDVILIDLGAGNHFHTIDLFLFADERVILFGPTHADVENGYRFIKSALLRGLSAVAHHETTREALRERLSAPGLGVEDPTKFLADLAPEFPEEADRLRREAASIRPKLILNGVKTDVEALLGAEIAQATAKHMGVALEYFANLPFDESVEVSSRERQPHLVRFPESRLAESMDLLVSQMMKHSQLPLQFQ